MPLNYTCPTNNTPVSAYQRCSCFGLPPNPPFRFLQCVVSTNNDVGDQPLPSLPTLSSLAAHACVNHITAVNAFFLPDDAVEVERFVCDNSEFPFAIQRVLYKAFYHRWQSLSVDERPWLAEAIATERILNGQPCNTVAQAHGISRNSHLMHKLDMVAVNGLAGARVHDGRCCFDVADVYGIELDSLAFNELQKKAVMGRAGERVRGGESCIRVADEHGISEYYEAMDMLEMEAVNSCAGEQVRNGLCCWYVAAKHGINPSFLAMNELASIAVRTVAGERVRRGEPIRQVIRDHGVNCSARAINELEMIAARTFGIERVYNGESSLSVANSLDISLVGLAAK